MKTKNRSRSLVKLFVLAFALLLSSKVSMPEVAAADTTEIATLRGHSLSLSGDITLNFYVELSEGFKSAVTDNSSDVTATIGISEDDTTSITVDAAYLEENGVTVNDGDGSHACHKFSYSVVAKNMRDDITLTLGYGESSTVITNSVQDYLEDAKSATEEDYPGLSLLADKMEDYGVKAQEHFNPNAEYEGELEISSDISKVNADTVEGYKMVKGDTVDGISPWGASLILESKVTLRLYFTKTEADITSLNVSGVGDIDLKQYNSTIYYIDIVDICPNDLGIVYSIKAKDTTLMKCSALSYVHNVLNNENIEDTLKGLLQSLYLYYGGAVNYVTDELPVHCACGKSPSTTDACDVCGGTALTWKPWLELDTLPTESGNYFLIGGVALEAQQDIKQNAKVCLDLNGKTVARVVENGRIYSTNAGEVSLHITDTSEEATGTLKGNGSYLNQGMIVWVSGTGSQLHFYAGTMDVEGCIANYGVAVAVENSASFTMYDGTIKGGSATYSSGSRKQGGSVFVTNGDFSMKGGTIAGGTALGLGGNICLASGSSFTMNGGTIKGGTSTNNDGGNIYVGGKFTMTDGMITGGSATNSNTENVYVNGETFTMSGGKITGHVLVDKPVTITLTGTPVISGNDKTNLSLKTGKKISIGDLADGAKIGVTVTDAEFATDAVDSDRKYFTSDAGQYIEWTTDGKLKLKDTYTAMGNNILSSLNYSVEKESGELGKERYNAFYKAYKKYMPDVFALQEYDVRWHNYMNNVDSCATNANLKPITELGYTGVTTEQKELSANNTPIYYNTNTLELKASGWVEYDVTKDITNHGFTWAVFQPKGSDEKFIVSSTHIIAHYGDLADDVISEYKKQQIQELVAFMNAKESEYSAPIIMLGDYNVSPVQTAYTGFGLGNSIVSARDVAKVVEGSEYQTSNSVGIAPPSTDVDGTKVIDHCMISMTGIAPMKYQTLVEEISDGVYTYTYADHVPQLFTFGLSDNNGHVHTYEVQWTSETNNYISHLASCVCGVTKREKHTWNITKGTKDVVASCTDCNMSLTTDGARVGCHCANVGNIENHTCEDKIWKAWTRTDSLPVGSGYYYLTSDVQLREQQNIYAGADIYLDLNGKTVTGAQNARMYSTNAGEVSLHITDTSEGATGTLKASGTYADQGMIVWVSGTDSKLYFYAGTMDAKGCTSNNGVAVAVDSGSFTMYGGTIKGGTANNQGGSVHVKASFTMYGGTIQDGTATGLGGNICLTSTSTFAMHGGTIQNGESSGSNAGNIYVGKTFTMTGGTITNGSAKNGGNIYQGGGTITVSGGNITGGTASADGGNIYQNSGTITMSAGNITGGSATTDSNGEGGTMYVKGTLNITGGKIQGGAATHTGGAVNLASGTMTVQGSAVIDGGSANYGGCIAVMGGSLTMNGGTIQEGTSYNGGCLYIKTTFNMNGGTITSGTASNAGGNIYMTNAATMNYEGAAVLQNITNSQSGKITTGWTTQQGVFVVTGGTTTNTATE